jgi:C4-dicarboxylate transporter DctM subunit
MIRRLHKIEDLAAFMAIFLLALFPTMEVVARKFFHTGVRNSTEYTHHLVLLLTFIAGMITSREKKHLSLALELRLPPDVGLRVRTAVALLSAGLTAAMAWTSLSFALSGFDPQQTIGPVPLRWIAAVMAIGYCVMSWRFVTGLPGSGYPRPVAALGLLFGSWLALDPIANIWTALGGSTPVFFTSLLNTYHQANLLTATPLILLLVASAFFGAPIFIVLGGIGFLLFARQAQALEVIPNEAFSLLTGQSLPAIPLFTFTGFLLSESKAGERLVGLFRALFSWIPGGLAIMAVLVCAFFTTFTGASGVTILALGALLSYVLLRGKYTESFSTGLLTASGSIGLLFPPSLPIIIYGVTAGVSIKDMFLGGILPGVVLVLVVIVFSIFHATRDRVEREPFSLRETLIGFRGAFWEIALPVVIIGSYFGGLTTLVESGAIAVIYALLVEVVVHRDLKVKQLPAVMLKCVPIIGGVLTILALANGLAYYIIDAEIPMKLAAWVQTAVHSKYLFLLLLNLALLVVGCFMDIFSATLVVVPLIIPLAQIFAIHPVHLGIVFLANMELGYLTPPVGLNLYLAAYRFNKPITRIYRDVMVFLIIQIIAVLLITYIPFLSTAMLTK